MNTIYLPGFGNREDKISKQLPKETLIVQETIGKIEVEEKTIKTILDRTNNIFEKTEQITQIKNHIGQLEQAKTENNEEQKIKILNQLRQERTQLLENTSLRKTIQNEYPGTTINDLVIKLTTIFVMTHHKNEIIEKIVQRFGSQTKPWIDCIQDTKKTLFEIFGDNNIEPIRIYAHSQGGLLLGHIYQSLSEKEKTIWNKKVEKVILVNPVSQPQEAKDFHKLHDGLYRQPYLHPGRDLIVTQKFLDSIVGSELIESLHNIEEKPTIILGKDDPYLPGWNVNRIQSYKNQGYTIETIEGDHYPLIIQ